MEPNKATLTGQYRPPTLPLQRHVASFQHFQLKNIPTCYIYTRMLCPVTNPKDISSLPIQQAAKYHQYNHSNFSQLPFLSHKFLTQSIFNKRILLQGTLRDQDNFKFLSLILNLMMVVVTSI